MSENHMSRVHPSYVGEIGMMETVRKPNGCQSDVCMCVCETMMIISV